MVTQADFDSFKRDLTRLAYDDTLDVFRNSPVLFELQRAIVNQAQELHDAAVASLWARVIDGAEGAQLDVLGRIVGLYPRPTADGASIDYFTPDEPLLGPDWAGAYVAGAPLSGRIPIGDVPYRTAIRTKIAKNHVKYGSAPELAYFAQLAYGVLISVRNIGDSELEIVVAPSVAPSLVAALTGQRTDETADVQYALPIPATARIKQVSYRYPGSFAPDLASGAPDYAPVGVSFNV